MPVIHLTWPDCKVRKTEVLGQFQVVHIGFRLICVVNPYVIQGSYYDNQWVLQYKRQFWADGENFQYWHFRSFVAFREGIRPATKRDPSSLSRSRIFSCRQIQRCQSLQSASRTRVFKDSRPNLYQNSSRAFQALFLQKLIQVSLWHCYGWPLSNGKIVINVKKYKKKSMWMKINSF